MNKDQTNGRTRGFDLIGDIHGHAAPLRRLLGRLGYTETDGGYCPERKWQPLPITEVQRQIEGLMLELFAVSKSHGVERAGKSQRGFRGVKFMDRAN